MPFAISAKVERAKSASFCYDGLPEATALYFFIQSLSRKRRSRALGRSASRVPARMSRKRPAVDDPPAEEDDDPLARLLSVLNETVTDRAQLHGCLMMADNLHRMLLSAHNNAAQRVTEGASAHAMMQQLTQAYNLANESGGASSAAGGSVNLPAIEQQPVNVVPPGCGTLFGMQGVIPLPSTLDHLNAPSGGAQPQEPSASSSSSHAAGASSSTTLPIATAPAAAAEEEAEPKPEIKKEAPSDE